jgi:hypothetical protein
MAAQLLAMAPLLEQAFEQQPRVSIQDNVRKAARYLDLI